MLHRFDVHLLSRFILPSLLVLMNKPTIVTALLLISFSLSAQVKLIPYGSMWKYLDNGSNQGTAWKNISFNDTTWSSGLAELGYGDGDETTVVNYGPDANNRYITTY